MKQFLSLLGLMATLNLRAASPDVHIAVTDFTLAITPGSRTVTLTPVESGALRTGTSDSAGNVTLSMVAPMDYTLTISGADVSLTLRVPQSYALLHARDLVVGDWTRPTPAGSAAASANLRAWSLLATDPLALPGALKLSGETNELTVANGSLLLDGAAIGGGEQQTQWTNSANSTRLLIHTNLNSSVGVSAGNASDIANAEKPAYFYTGTYGLTASAAGTNSTGANVGMVGQSTAIGHWNIGVAGSVFGSDNNTTNSGIYGAVATYGSSGIFNALVGELVNDESALPEIIQETSVLLLDNRNTAAPLIIARDNGVTKFRVNTNGAIVLAGTTNQITFGGTNTAPVVTTNAAKWISVQVGSLTNAYRLPLYE